MNIHYIVSFILGISLFITNCEPPGITACECYSESKINLLDANTHVLKECANKYRDQIDPSYVGTPRFADEWQRLSGEDCED